MEAVHVTVLTVSKYVVFFHLADSRVSEFYVLMFWNNLSHLHTTYEDGTVCSEMSAHKIQILENHPKERIEHPEHKES